MDDITAVVKALVAIDETLVIIACALSAIAGILLFK